MAVQQDIPFVKANDLKGRAAEALQDVFLRRAVAYTTDRLREKKEEAARRMGDWESWRERGKQIRAHTMTHLDVYLEQFAEQLTRCGGQVHFASTAREATETVLHIAREKSAHRVVKSKSMVTEEIHLNAALEKEGLRVVETDLGEYIIQLAQETPSHIIIPAIHKTREQIAELFSRVKQGEVSTDTKALTAFAREKLRQEFLLADVGITGCNFAVAQSGSITMVTNEGNGRMCNTLPPVHIVLMGMERVVPTWGDLEVMLNLLPRSATGQDMTSYVSIVNGPKRSHEWDGPQELHVIILDNGRTDLLGEPQFQEVLHCIRCGACLNVCPVYRQIGGHAYGSVYPGPIGAVLTPLLTQDWEGQGELAYASSLCGACYEACPVQIPLHDMLVSLRQKRVEKGFAPAGEKSMFKAYALSFSSHRRYGRLLKAAAWLQKPMVVKGRIRKGPPPISSWTASRTLPPLAKSSFREMWREGLLERKKVQKDSSRSGKEE